MFVLLLCLTACMFGYMTVSFAPRQALPNNAKVAKDGKDTVQECVSEFVSFITSEASDKCQREKRKTINGDDILWAMSTLGFDKYIEPLKQYLARYRETVMQEKGDDATTKTEEK
jgi:nuclear transcription Y subunit beta